MTTATIVAGDAAGIARACRALRDGGVVGMPTETVYGLAADARNPRAVAAIYAIKGRPAFNPLIAHVDSPAMARREGQLDARCDRLVEAFWPGPLTLVVPAAANGSVCELARAGLRTIALRFPAHRLARELLEAIGCPLAAPSANPSGRLSPTRAIDVAEELGERVEVVLDGGQCDAGIESTIVAVLPDSDPALLRPGAIAREAIEQVVGRLAESPEGVMAPGQLTSHYAPNARVRLDAATAGPGEVLLGFGGTAPDATLDLSPRADLREAAANLYQMLRTLDATGAACIAVSPIPSEGLGEAINDRLRRAAAAPTSPDT